MPRYHCLIPDKDGKAVLAIADADGGWSLPAIEHDSEWIAYAAIAVAQGAAARFGAAMTMLHERSREEIHVCELEVQDPHWTAPAGTRWISQDDLAELALQPAGLAAVLRGWFAEQQTGAIPATRAPWSKKGWHAEAGDWIAAQCARLGYLPAGPVEQVKAGWSLSAILRLHSSAGTLYFKADYAKPPSEPVVIQALARLWPRHVPAVIAADYERGWMLMRDFGTRTLEREPFVRWQAANRTFAAIQAACSENLDPWWRLGCPDLRIPVLVRHMDRLLGDDAALRIGEPDGLPPAGAARLRQLTPRLHDMWDELAALALPATLVQQDFRHDNLVMSGRSYLFHDWSDTVIGHPFFSCCRFLDFIPEHSGRGLPREERKRRIIAAYLEPWRDFAAAPDLARAFALARLLHPLYLAIRWTIDAPYCEPGSYWWRTLRRRPAQELGRLLEEFV